MSPRAVSAAAAALAALLLAGAARAAEPTRPFSHETHFLGAGVACTTCHPQPAGAAPPAVERKACAVCHEQATPAYLPLAKPAPLGLPVAFPHGQHVRGGVACVDCHDRILEPAVAAGPVLGPARCFACHAERAPAGVQAACAGCHGVPMRKTRPADHATAWAARHGPESRLRVFDQHGRDCFACHGNDACRSCHRVQAPRSHTGLWRLRTHGVAASWDREGCKTCHEAGGCTGCHRETRPLNHTASWRAVHGLAAQSADNQTCAACHARGFCAGCHNQR